MAIQLIEHEVDRLFLFDPPLKGGYVQKYLKDALYCSRYMWRTFWRKHGTSHPNCPIKRFHALVSHWQTLVAKEESSRMQRVRMNNMVIVDCSDDNVDDDVQIIWDNSAVASSEGSGINSYPP